MVNPLAPEDDDVLMKKRMLEALPEGVDFKVAAELFDVHVMTVKKWVTEGRLATTQTPGGTVKIHTKWLAEFLTVEWPKCREKWTKKVVWNSRLKTNVRLIIRALLAEAILKNKSDKVRVYQEALNGHAKPEPRG